MGTNTTFFGFGSFCLLFAINMMFGIKDVVLVDKKVRESIGEEPDQSSGFTKFCNKMKDIGREFMSDA